MLSLLSTVINLFLTVQTSFTCSVILPGASLDYLQSTSGNKGKLY